MMQTTKEIPGLEEKAREIRKKVLGMCVKAGTGHVTSSFSSVEILVALYHGGVLHYDVKNPQWGLRDRFILSKGQASPLLYAVLADLGFFPDSAVQTFCQAGGMFGVHLQHDVPGVEITSGSLGHGLGIGAGMALAARMDRASHRVFVLLGDGECYEGSIWESALFASHHQLNNLIAIVDRNSLCVTDFTEKIVRLDPLDEKWRSFGWDTATVNGHSFGEIFSILDQRSGMVSDRPLAVIAQTVKGRGVSFMENQILWHGIAPKGEEADRARKELGIGDEEWKTYQ